MQSDLAITITVAAVALALVALLLWWVGRASSSETLSWEKKLGIWDKATQSDERRFRAGHAAVRPFLQRYANILAVCAVLTIVCAFFSDIAALIVYIIGLVFLVLGVMVIRKKANSFPVTADAPEAAPAVEEVTPERLKRVRTSPSAPHDEQAVTTSENEASASTESDANAAAEGQETPDANVAEPSEANAEDPSESEPSGSHQV